MLVDLAIRDLALIESLELALGPGLNAISGETGAGKSLFVGALELLRGENVRGGAGSWIRKGAREARVEGRFELVGAAAIERCLALLEREAPAVAEAWSEACAEAPDPERAELLVGRRLSRQGRSGAHVHQHPVPLRTLRALAPLLLEIHGQNEHQRLLLAAEQRALLDAYGGLAKPVDRHAAAARALGELLERRDRLEERRAERRDRLDLLRFQVEELRGAELRAGELEALREERELLRGAADLRAELGAVAHGLAESEESLLDRLRHALQRTQAWGERLPRLAPAIEDLASAEIHVAEAAALLGSVVDGVSDDPERLELVEERLHLLERLTSKFDRDEAGLLAHLDALEVELEELEHADESLAELEQRIEAARAERERAARALLRKRRALAPKLREAVEANLARLGLERARFDLTLSEPSGPESAPGERGDEVAFLLAANPGEEPAPLRHVASGGETARIMLALRSVLHAVERAAEHGTGPVDARTLVFDEIDSGVGGRLGPEVAAQLELLAGSAQVLCVTHIPAIAAAADLHLGTVKEVRGGRTRTAIRVLEGDERVREVADMIAGGSDHETARAEARRLLAASPR